MPANMMIEKYKYGKWEVFKLREDRIEMDKENESLKNSEMIDFIDNSNLEGKNVVDGGSNIGLMSLILSEAVGDGLVYCFELQRVICQIGCANAILNNRFNIISFNMALSDRSGEMVGFSNIDYSGEYISSVGVRTESNSGSIDYYDRAKTVALDDLNIQNIGLIKLDIEGSEPQALDGMWKSIERWKPNLIIEISTGYLGDKANELIEKIKSRGYSITEGKGSNYYCKPIKI